MYRTLTNSEFFRCLPYRRFMLNNIISDFYCPLLNIIFHTKPLHSLFLQCMQRLLFIFPKNLIRSILPSWIASLDPFPPSCPICVCAALLHIFHLMLLPSLPISSRIISYTFFRFRRDTDHWDRSFSHCPPVLFPPRRADLSEFPSVHPDPSHYTARDILLICSPLNSIVLEFLCASDTKTAKRRNTGSDGNAMSSCSNISLITGSPYPILMQSHIFFIILPA